MERHTSIWKIDSLEINIYNKTSLLTNIKNGLKDLLENLDRIRSTDNKKCIHFAGSADAANRGFDEASYHRIVTFDKGASGYNHRPALLQQKAI